METILLRIMCDRFFSDNSKVSEISNILIYYGSLTLGILLKKLCLYERHFFGYAVSSIIGNNSLVAVSMKSKIE